VRFLSWEISILSLQKTLKTGYLAFRVFCFFVKVFLHHNKEKHHGNRIQIQSGKGPGLDDKADQKTKKYPDLGIQSGNANSKKNLQ
jgi:hypothetical protein